MPSFLHTLSLGPNKVGLAVSLLNSGVAGENVRRYMDEGGTRRLVSVTLRSLGISHLKQ